MATQIELAVMAGRAYQNTRNIINWFPVPDGWTEFFHEPNPASPVISGFEAVSFQRGNEIVISFAGTGPEILDPDWMFTNVTLGLGTGGQQLLDAAAYYMQIRAENPGATITLTGHSLGGGLAALIGVFFNEQAVTFNPAPFRASANNDVRAALVSHLAGLGYTSGPAIDALNSFTSSLPANQTGPSETPGVRGEGNVSIVRVVGEAISASTILSPWDPLGLNAPTLLTHGGANVSAIDLHSQALLVAMLQSTAFREASIALPDLLPMVFDNNLFARNTSTSAPNFLEHLLRYEMGAEGEGMLSRFATDLNKIVVAQGMSSDARLAKALIGLAMEYHYNQTGGDQFLFEPVGDGLKVEWNRFTANPLSMVSLPLLNDYVWNSGVFSEAEQINFSTALADYPAWIISAAAGGNVSAATAQDTLMLGSVGDDTLLGSDGSDRLIGGKGEDRLVGGAGADVLIGGDDDDILDGRDGAGGDILIGGAGFDTYYADEDDTIRDSDGKGVIFLNGKQLTFATRKKGETVWKDAAGNTYALNGGRLEINDPLIIEDFDNSELSIYLDEEEEPEDPSDPNNANRRPRPPGYNPNNAQQTRRYDPLILDLDGNGQIDAIGSAQSTIYFDFNGDGISERAGWVAPQDGFLALDDNANGVIDGLSELFGTNQIDGFVELAGHDSNGDGRIDALDEDFTKLRVWQDANQDGISQSGEIKTLEALGISSINLVTTAANIPVADNLVTATGSFTRNGESQLVADIHLAVNFALTDSNPNRPLDIAPQLDTEIFGLPWLRGYGNVKSLHVAFQENPDLRQAGAELAAQGWLGVLRNFDGFMAKWTGLALAHAAHGVTRANLSLEDKVWMLENLTGQDVQKSAIESANFGAISLGGNQVWNAVYIDSAWNSFVQREALSFAIQASTRDWLRGASYSLGLDRFVVVDAPRLHQSLLDYLNNVTDKESAAFAAVAVDFH